MAIYHLTTKPVRRSKGHNAVAGAAYRSGGRLTDRRTGEAYDFSNRFGVEHSEIVLPSHTKETDWALDRETLWNAAEGAERRKDGRPAREVELALPHELDAEGRERLVRGFAQDLSDTYGVAVDVAIHLPARDGDKRNHHAHLYLTTRVVGAEGLGAKSRWELGDKDRWKQGVPLTSRQELVSVRAAWSARANEALAEAGRDERIDHRSFADQDIELEPTRHVGPTATNMDRAGTVLDRVAEDRAIRERNADLIERDPTQIFRLIGQSRAVFDHRDVAKVVSSYVDDLDRFQRVYAKALASGELVELQAEGKDGDGCWRDARMTTRSQLRLESATVSAATRMDGERGRFWVSPAKRDAAIETQPFELTDEQREAVEHVTDSNRLSLVTGIAGAGKSTMLAVAREAWEAQGYTVKGAALAGKAAEGLEQSAGIESRTLASWENAFARGNAELTANDVFVIDEAGMVGTGQLSGFIRHADRAGAKVVLVGDGQQLQAINAGAAFRMIEERVGSAALTTVRRQREDWQREATGELARGHVEAAIDAYEERGHVHAHETQENAREAVVDAFMDAHEAGDSSVLVLTHRRRDVAALNASIRERMKERGELEGGAGFETANGRREFATGDRIYFLRNDRGMGVKNGTLGTVLDAEDGALSILPDGAEEAVSVHQSGYDRIDHGYAATIHKTQGATADRTIVLTSQSMDRQLAYVGMSRHRDGVELHWSAEEFGRAADMRDALARDGSKENAFDYLTPEKETAMREERQARADTGTGQDTPGVDRPLSELDNAPAPFERLAQEQREITEQRQQLTRDAAMQGAWNAADAARDAQARADAEADRDTRSERDADPVFDQNDELEADAATDHAAAPEQDRRSPTQVVRDFGAALERMDELEQDVFVDQDAEAEKEFDALSSQVAETASRIAQDRELSQAAAEQDLGEKVEHYADRHEREQAAERDQGQDMDVGVER